MERHRHGRDAPARQPESPLIAVRKRLGQSVGERFRHDRIIIVVVCVEAAAEVIEANSCCDRKGADVMARSTYIVARHGRSAATTPPAKQFEPGQSGSLLGYGYQTWIFPGERPMFALLGVRGQTILIDPISRLVMVHTAVRKQPAGPTEARALWQGLVRALGS